MNLKKTYEVKIKQFKKTEELYCEKIYKLMNQIKKIGYKMNPNYSIVNNLCEDLGITYERYKFYMKFRYMTKERKELIKSGKIRQSVMMNILHRFPEENFDEIITNQLEFQLSKPLLLSLRAKDAFKKRECWIKAHDSASSLDRGNYSKMNKRAIRIYLKRIRAKLPEVVCFQDRARNEIYLEVEKTYNYLGDWIYSHKDWCPSDDKKK